MQLPFLLGQTTTTNIFATPLPNQQAVKGVPKEVNEKNEPVKTVSEATVDLGYVVEAIKKIEEEGQGVSEEVKAEILKNEKHASTILEETGHISILNELQAEDATEEVAAIRRQTSPCLLSVKLRGKRRD